MSDPPPASDETSEEGFDAAAEDYAVRYEAGLPVGTRDASAALMFGILGLATCGLLSPLAIYYGHRALRRSDAVGGDYEYGEGNARIGQILGVIGTTLLILGLILTFTVGLRAWDFVSDRLN